MRLSENGLSILALMFMAGTFVFAGFIDTQAAVFHQEGTKESELRTEGEEKIRRVEKRAEDLARRMEERFQSAEWEQSLREMNERIWKIEQDLDERLNNPEFQEQMRRIEETGRRIGDHFQGEDWRQFEARMQSLGAEMSEQFQSSEWKEAMARIQKETQQLDQDFRVNLHDSSEWKAHQKEIEELAKSIKEALGEDWQQQIREMEREIREVLKDLPQKVH